MTEEFWVVGGLAAVIILVTSYMFISAKVHFAVKMLLAAATVAMSLTAWTVTKGILGYGVSGMPMDGDLLISFVFDMKDKKIYLWAVENKQPRGFVIPWNDKIAKKLLDALEKQTQQGGQMFWHLGQGPQGEGKQGNGRDGGGNSGNGLGSDAPENISIDVEPSLPKKG